MRAEARQEPEGADLEHAPERFVGLAQPVDLGHHRAAGVGIQTADGRLVDAVEVLGRQVIAARRGHAGDLDHVGVHRHPERAQERLGDRAAGHPCRGLAGAGALEHVAHIAEAVLLGADEVGVTGPGQVDLVDARATGHGFIRSSQLA